jgi:hypothetical protein
VQLVAGSNSAGQLLGLVNVTGIKTVTATDASPTTQEIIAKLWAGYDQIATSGYRGDEPTRNLGLDALRALRSAICRISGTAFVAPSL